MVPVQKSVSPISPEVKSATKAMLVEADRRRLPRSWAQTEGVLLRQKNTFFHVELDESDQHDYSSLDSSEMNACLLVDSPSLLPYERRSDELSARLQLSESPSNLYNTRRSPPRKQTESSIVYGGTRRSSTSSFLATSCSASRCHSCPPTALPTVDQPPTPPVCSPTPSPVPVAEPTPVATPSPSPRQRNPKTVLSLELRNLLAEAGGKTTVMLRNVPYHEGQDGVMRILESHNFRGKFDFFYAPLDFASGNNLGYCFINMRNNRAVSEFYAVFNGLRVEDEGWSLKQLAVCWARVQGVQANIEQYRNSPVNEMPVQFRPMLFNEAGEQLPFPAPDNHNNHPRQLPAPTGQRMGLSNGGHMFVPNSGQGGGTSFRSIYSQRSLNFSSSRRLNTPIRSSNIF